jgi:PAS domain S-box-containing protein
LPQLDGVVCASTGTRSRIFDEPVRRVASGMKRASVDPSQLTFLAGGGEMGRRMRDIDWAQTALGTPKTWPQSLRSTVSMLLPSKAQMILFWGPQFIVLYNDAYRPVFGAKHPDALGRPGREAWSEIWESQLHALLDGVVRTGEAFWARDLLFHLERYGFLEETYFDVSYDPVRIESGSVGGVFCIVAETTDRVVGERRLALLRDLAARNATARTEREACVLAVDTLAGKPDVAFALAYLGDELQAATADAEQQLADTAPAFVKTLPLTAAPGGREGRLIIGVNPRRPFDDGYRSFLDLVADQLAIALTNARAYEAERQRAEALAALDRAKTAFFSNVSHEFRTPLTLLVGPLEDELTDTAGSPAVRRERLETAHRNALRLLRLVNSLLDFSRIEAGRIDAAYEPTDLAVLTTDLSSAFRSAIEKAGLTLVVDCPPLPSPVYVDRDMWEKIVLNLLSNAFKFTFEGEIRVELRMVGDQAELRVADTGVGIPAGDVERVFDRFHRVRHTRARTHEGTGIGLALVQELARLHGGTASVISEEGRGTAFTVTVRAGTSHLPSDRIGLQRRSAAASVGPLPYVEEALRWLPAEGRMPPRLDDAIDTPPVAEDAASAARVLVADDNADMRDYLARILKPHYRVDVVADGRAALDRIRAQPPDLVLTDVMMPTLDGFGLLAAVRADPRSRSLPVVLLSARAGQEARIEGLRAGADEYLVKPFSARELLASVASQIQLARVRRESGRTAQYLAAVVDSAEDAIITKDLNGVIQSANAAAERLFGYSSDELVGRSVRILIPPERQSEEDQILARTRRGERVEHFETVRITKDGQRLDIALTVSPVRDDTGTIVGASKIGRNITAIKRVEAERIRLLEENALVTETLNNVGALVASDLDQTKVVQAVTDAATELTTAEFGAFFYNVLDERDESYTLYTISGVPRELFSKFPMPRNTAVFEPTFKGTSVVRSDDITEDSRYGHNTPYHGMPPGHLPVRSYLAVPVKGRGGNVIGGLFFGHSQTGRFDARHERIAVGIASWASVALENAHLYMRAQEASQVKDDFLASLSHELRTPLNAILGYARMLQSGMLPAEKKQKAIDTIERNATSLTQIVEDVLDISRIVSGKIRLNVQAVDLPTIVRNAVDAVMPAGDAKGVRIEMIVDPQAAPVSGDPERLQQILWNLLSNAVKFTHRGGKVQVRLERVNSHVEVIVSDTGVGIAPEFLPHVFERFRQADGGITRERGGLGLGLSIARQLTEMHGGTIEASSAGLNQGATFCVKIPLMIMQPVQDQLPRVHPRSTSAAAKIGAVTLNGIHVLAVDDEPDALSLVCEALESVGARTSIAQSAADALAKLVEEIPDVVVADLGMPHVDGFAFIEQVRQHPNPRVREIPAAALTAYARSEDRMKALGAGFQIHLAKPIDPAELVTTIASLAKRVIVKNRDS